MIIFDRKKAAGAAAARSSDGEIAMSSDEFKLLSADIISAVKSGSEEDLSKALKAFYYLCDSKPHEEGPHE